MANELYVWLDRVKAVEREHTATRFTVDHVLRTLGEGAVDLNADLKRLDLTTAADRLEGTYVIRLFSEFEVALKVFLTSQKLKKIPRDAKPLINRTASHVKFSGSILDNTHEARLYRNELVHRLVHAVPEDRKKTIRTITSYLTTFLGRLPPNW